MNPHEETKQSSTGIGQTSKGKEKDDHARGIRAQAEGSSEGPQEALAKMIGRRFGRLVVIGYLGRSSGGRSRLECRCDCGASKLFRADHVAGGLTQSCGCLRKEKIASLSTKHGMAKLAEYKIWLSMRSRCNNRNNAAYNRYGGRHIVVCDRWEKSFVNFLADMGPRPSNNHSIDRIDNNGNYEPLNCRWATASEQQNNTRRTKILTHLGLSMSVAQWERHLHHRPDTIRRRLQNGWPVEKALDTPLVRPSRHSVKQMSNFCLTIA